MNNTLQATYTNVRAIKPNTLASDGGSGDNGSMEQRVRTLENNMVDVRERLARIETRLEHTATKEDIARVETSIARATNKLMVWSVGTLVALFAVTKWFA